ncbi:MAG: acyl-CoA dehydrogenase family protein, partial [Pseudomonadota bacterium]|nr:acyl-CoA dehydrogenase family protein [Pseudomonadota bacterium]
MDFSFTEEQTLLQESVSRFMQNDYGFEARQKNASTEQGFSAENWQTFAELGWLGVPFSEADGGFGGGAIETALMSEQFGRGLLIEPFLATVILAGGAIKHGGSEEQKSQYLPGIIDGSKHAALAFVEPQARFNIADITTTATADGDGYVLNGYKAVVLNGPQADFLVVSAR